MSTLEHFPVTHRLHGTKRSSGRFFPQGTDPVVAASTIGSGFTVERTGVGTFDVAFDAPYRTLLCADACVMGPVADVTHARVSNITFVGPSNDAVIEITTEVADAVSGIFAAADIAADTDISVGLWADFYDAG